MPTQTSTRQPAPPLIEQLNNGNWLPREEAEALRDDDSHQRGRRRQWFTQRPARYSD